MAPKFGTSGLRGLVVELTPDVITAHIHAFLASCDSGGTLYLGCDLRPSSPQIAATVAKAACAAGVNVIDCGETATPALALAAAHADAGAIMVTGSHIPADRNGLKFYTKGGAEITKAGEALIASALEQPVTLGACGEQTTDTAATDRFIDRYRDAFGATALLGRRIGVYEHSAVARDALVTILTGLGADIVQLGRADTFIPVDTEAVDPVVSAQIMDWVKDHRLDALVSTDGDSDRPLMADERGQIVPGDILGQITAEALKAAVVVTPVSSNSGVMHKGFQEVRRTPIGSPFVIDGMQGASRAVGYEANGGFLLGFTADGPNGVLAPLLTRDCVLPLIAPLVAAEGPLSERVAAEPAIFTKVGRLQEMPTEASRALVTRLTEDATARADFLAPLGVTETDAPDLTDGLRIPLDNSRTLHIRPSGNAPELRLYIEANSPEGAAALLAAGLDHLRSILA
ncbi:MAG: phosphomannomutase [Pseudomonadota bacterium]